MEPLIADALPVVAGEDGVIRVVGTRVPMDTIIDAFDEGATPEEIAQQYPSIPLADVYQLIAHYLKHTPELKAYLERRRRQAGQVRQKNESRAYPHGIRQRLLLRRNKS